MIKAQIVDSPAPIISIIEAAMGEGVSGERLAIIVVAAYEKAASRMMSCAFQSDTSEKDKFFGKNKMIMPINPNRNPASFIRVNFSVVKTCANKIVMSGMVPTRIAVRPLSTDF